MEILSLFVKDHFLFNQPEYFNFGGAFTFDFKIDKNILKIQKFENNNYISSFYGDEISNISAIVGNNGVGKTSIMKIVNDPSKEKIVSIYYNGKTFFVKNITGLEIEAQFDYEDYNVENDLFPMYYSNHIDYNLKNFHSPISQSNLIDDSLEDYYYGTILRQVFFLNQKGQFLKDKFRNLPYYENLTIKVNQIDKSKFIGSDFYKNATIGKSIKKQLEVLWNHYNVSNESNVHGNQNFITNFQVFVLSLLVSDDSFAQTNDNGNKIYFEQVLEQDDFKLKLEVFLKKRLNNIDNSLFEILDEEIGINFENTDELITKIESNNISTISGGFDFNIIKNHSIQTIIRYSRIWELYKFLSHNADKTIVFEKPSEIKISVKHSNSKNFLNTFLKLYQEVEESLQYIAFDFRIFSVNPEKKLSTGEHSLLNFYSSIYAFVRKGENHLRQKNQYLLLLDEPETGYHASWKKKFIKSITDILPLLFDELNQKPSIQIIFSTHDALTLSDIPNNNITYLQKLNNSIIKVFKPNEQGRPMRSFGANITDLLSDSFFIDDGLVGDFAKNYIHEIIEWINNKDRDPSKYDEIHKLISIIDEPIVQNKLAEMFDQKLNKNLRVSIIRQQIIELQRIEKEIQ